MAPESVTARKGQQEYRAGYLHGLNGGERPARDKGSAFYGGWLCGKAEREEQREQGGSK